MRRFLPDTSCMVAAVCSWHERHADVADELERRLGSGDEMVVAAPALVETYAVLTRLPAPHRIAPKDALALIEANFINMGDTVALEAASYHRLLQQAPEEGVAGGRTYDSVIAACALKAKVPVLLTLNARHFLPFATKAMSIVTPAVASAT